MQRAILIAFIISIGACAALGVYMIANNAAGGFTSAVLGSLALIAAASVLGLASSAVWLRRTWQPLGLVGVLLAPIALVLSLIPIWGTAWNPAFNWVDRRPWWFSDGLLVALGLTWVAAVGASHIGLLGLARLHRRFFWVRRLTILLIAALAMNISVVIFDEDYFSRRFQDQSIPILVILVVFGTLIMPVLHRFSALKTHEFVHTVAVQLQVTCPRCALAQTLGVGRSACTQCGLRFVIQIEENVCEKCGYALYKLESSTCPECGTPILQNSVTASPSA